jgi:hypothetical protein
MRDVDVDVSGQRSAIFEADHSSLQRAGAGFFRFGQRLGGRLAPRGEILRVHPMRTAPRVLFRLVHRRGAQNLLQSRQRRGESWSGSR